MSGDEELITLFKRAAEIASAVPEPMREAAFHRALDALQQGTTSGQSSRGARRRTGRSELKSGSSGVDPVRALNDLARSRAADVDNETGALGKALALLRVAERELSIERLSAPQIANVLTEKFRWRVTRQAVTEALEKSGRLVDRRKEGRSVTYRLMQPGEQWLDADAEARGGATGASRPGATRTGVTKKARKGNKSAAKKAQPDAASSRPAAKSRGGRTGPKAAVESLISSGYFSSPRTLADLQQNLQHDRALRFKPTDLSPALTRLLREGRLSRAKNADGQYEYIAPSA